jgi:hypothetical protein
VPSPAPAATKAPRAMPAPAVQNRLSLSVNPMQTYFTNSNLNSKAPTLANRMGFQIGYDVAPRITAYWSRTPNDSLQPNSANPSLDLIDEIGASYRLARNWSVSAEQYHRWRQCCAGAGDVSARPYNPVASRGWSILMTYAFGPDTIIGKPFSFTYQGIEFKHDATNVAAATPTAFKQAGTLNEGTKYTSGMTLGYRMPLFHQRKVVPFVNVQELPTYFDNSVEPIYSNAVNYGATVVGSRVVTYNFSVRNLYEHHLGYPSPLQHYSWLIVNANFHGRFF